MKFIYLLFILLFLTPNLWAQSNVREMQELRLAKAELALSQGKERFALYLVGKNIDSKNFHMDSYLFLANYYLEQRRISKAFRVYHYVLKKLHPKGARRFLNAANITTLEKEMKYVAKPSQEALAIYFTLGQTYFDLEAKGVFAQSFTKQLLLNSKKYFTISNHYKFQRADSNFFLGSINSRLNTFSEAITNLSAAIELYIEEEKVSGEKRSTEIQNINFMLADALIREGHTDSGAIFLKGLYLNPNASSSLKEYANSYLDSLNSVYKIVTLSFGLSSDNNVHFLTDTESEEFDEFYKGSLVAQDALFLTKNFNYFYSSERMGDFSYVFFVDATEQTLNDERKYFLENRSFTLGATLKWDTDYKVIYKTGYSASRYMTKGSQQGGYDTAYDTHELAPEIVRSSKYGTFSLRFPFTLTIITDSDTTLSYGSSVSFNPFWKNKYISPTFTGSYRLVDESSTDSDSKLLSLSTSNHLVFIKNLSTFLTFTYERNQNEDESLGYKQMTWNLDFSYVFKRWDNFSSTYRLTTIDKTRDDGEEVDNLQHTLNLSINF